MINCRVVSMEPGKNLRCLGVSLVFNEISWRFREWKHLEDKEDGEDALETNWEPPLNRAIDLAIYRRLTSFTLIFRFDKVPETIVHPICDIQPDNSDGPLCTYEHPSVLNLTHFDLVGRNCSAFSPISFGNFWSGLSEND